MNIFRIFTHICCWTIIVICSATIVSCKKEHEDNPTKDYTRVVLVYMAAENSLSTATASDINEMLRANKLIPKDSKLILYVDDYDTPAIYEIDRQKEVKSASSLVPVKKYDEDLDSAAPSTLDKIMNYTWKNYKADSYGIIFWSHGSGWTIFNGTEQYAKKTPKSSFGIDTNSTAGNYVSKMNISDMASVLAHYGNIDYILFDACFMQSVEVAYELRNTTKCIMASPAEIPQNGAPYHIILPALFEQNFNPDNVISQYNSYYANQSPPDQSGVLISAIDTRQLESFAEATATVIKNHDIESIDYSSLVNYYHFLEWGYSMPDMYDMKSVMMNLLTESEYTYWEREFLKLIISSYSYESWYSALSNHSIFGGEYIPLDESQFGGINMFMPLYKYNYYSFNNEYYTTEWGKLMKEKKAFR